MNDESLEATAEQLAARGHEALVARLRQAFAAAAAKHADIVTVDEDRLEELVQRSAQRADGIQWRRALADVACQELGIGLAEALAHPAVARVQELVGAPSYEETVGELADGPVVEAAADAPGAAAEAASGPEAAEEPAADAGSADDEPGEEWEEEWEDGADEDPNPLVLIAFHLSGVANLPDPEATIELRLSSTGLDILQGDDEVLGRLAWSEIQALDVPAQRGRRRPRGTLLVVRTRAGQARFEVRQLTPDQLRTRLKPLVQRFGGGA